MKRIFLFALTFLSAVGMSAQNPLPMDPEVRTGKLDNGLTYYIRHNEKPAQRAEFYLATDIGAIQEEPDQDGLAHFLEHMCFNGLKNLPGKQMLEYLQKIGAEFGRNINASTGIESTKYMLNNIPVIREGIIDTCLLVMHDYSHFVLNDPEEIDKERGVILEERRTRRTADWRMYMDSKQYFYKGSKYADCSLIGSQENLETFKPESLKNFYTTWYRPDNQAVIVVGDIDVDQIENKLKALFSDIPAPVNPKPKDIIKIPDNTEPIVGIVTDPEAGSSNITMIWKSEPMPKQFKNTDAAYALEMTKDLISMVMDERFEDITSKPDADFVSAFFGIGDLTRTCEAVMGEVNFKDEKAIDAFRAFYTEIEKMKRFGFNESEIQRAKDEILSLKEKQIQGADSRKNSEFVPALIGNFFENTPVLEPSKDYELASMVLSQLNSQVINTILQQIITDTNLVVVYNGPKKEGLTNPTEEELLAAMSEIKASEIAANMEENIDSDFVDASLLKGSPVKKTKTTLYGATEWTLKNGLKVVVLPTEYKKDQIVMSLFKEGGSSLIPVEDISSFESNVLSTYIGSTGVSKFPSSTVSKMLSGKQVRLLPGINIVGSQISGGCQPKDLETALQLMYLYFTDPRFDEDEFNAGLSKLEAILPNLDSNPDFIFQKEVTKTIYGDNPRTEIISRELLEKVNLKTIEKYYRKLFNDAAGCTLFVVGNVNLEELKPLVETYMGSIPKGKKAPEWQNPHMEFVKGNLTNSFKTDMHTPKCSVAEFISADIPYSVEKSVMFNAAKYILDMIYTDTLREEEGGTYGASIGGSMNRRPSERAYLEIVFDTNPESAEKLSALALEGLKKLAEEGPTEEQLTRTLENFRKKIPEDRISNNYWLGCLQSYYLYGEDNDIKTEEAVKNISSENIKKVLQDVLAQKNTITVIMSPDKTTE